MDTLAAKTLSVDPQELPQTSGGVSALLVVEVGVPPFELNEAVAIDLA
jgi:hypothetical protein